MVPLRAKVPPLLVRLPPAMVNESMENDWADTPLTAATSRLNADRARGSANVVFIGCLRVSRSRCADGDVAAGGAKREGFGYRLRLVVVPGVDQHHVANVGRRHALQDGRQRWGCSA